MRDALDQRLHRRLDVGQTSRGPPSEDCRRCPGSRRDLRPRGGSRRLAGCRALRAAQASRAAAPWASAAVPATPSLRAASQQHATELEPARAQRLRRAATASSTCRSERSARAPTADFTRRRRRTPRYRPDRREREHRIPAHRLDAIEQIHSAVPQPEIVALLGRERCEMLRLEDDAPAGRRVAKDAAGLPTVATDRRGAHVDRHVARRSIATRALGNRRRVAHGLALSVRHTGQRMSSDMSASRNAAAVGHRSSGDFMSARSIDVAQRPRRLGSQLGDRPRTLGDVLEQAAPSSCRR